MSDSIIVTTDQPDYTPDSVATFTALNVSAGATVEFDVAHVNAGADGVYGTADDLYTYDLTGTGVPWVVTDGGPGDLDGIVNGVITTSWFVNLDALGQTPGAAATDLATNLSATALFTDNLPPDASGSAGNLTTFDTFTASPVNGAVYQAASSGAGKGIFPAFVKLQNPGTEQGYNSDNSVQQFNENNNGNFNHSVKLADVPVIVGDGTHGTTSGVLYRQFLLDAHESTGGTSEYLSLDDVQIFQEAAGNLTGLTPASNQLNGSVTAGVGFSGGTNYLAYNLDAGATDNWIALNSALSAGSGNSDLIMLIPNSLFVDDAAHQYIYLYSQFGLQGGWETDSTPEEWALGVGSAIGSISGFKYQDADGNISTTGDQTPLSGWTIYRDWNHDNILDSGDISTTTDGSGHYSFGSLLPGTYTVREVLQAGWTQLAPLSPDEFTVTVVGNVDSSGHNFINNNGFDLSGKKLTDITGNGLSSDDTGLGGLTIFVDKDCNSSLRACDPSTVTASDSGWSLCK